LSDNRIHIVLVTAWFPPRKSVAVNRMQAFANYLSKKRFKLSVITLNEYNAPSYEIAEFGEVYREVDTQIIPFLKNKQGENKILHVCKVIWNVLLLKLIRFPHKSWMKRVEKRLEMIHQNKPIDLIISSFSPIEAHLATFNFLEKNKSVRWIADMRDEMSTNGQINNQTRKLLQKAEQKINKRADAITCVSDPILQDMKSIMNNITEFVEIRNGYDHELVLSRNHNAVFTIIYAGTFYGPRKPHTFFEGMKIFLAKHAIDFTIQFLGTHHNFTIPKEFEKNCEFIPPVDNYKAIDFISKADASLLILNEISRVGVYSGKIFDYLSVQKPIITLVNPNDVAADLIREYKAGIIADFNQPDEIANSIEFAWKIWNDKSFLSVDETKVKTLHRKHQVKILEDLILKIVSK
jgi:hypothetical protein